MIAVMNVQKMLFAGARSVVLRGQQQRGLFYYRSVLPAAAQTVQRCGASTVSTSNFGHVSTRSYSDEASTTDQHGEVEIHRGTVKWFSQEKGYGFIRPDNGGPDIFVHQTSIHAEGFRSLRDDEPVEFRVTHHEGRTRAEDVTGPNGVFVQGTSPLPMQDPKSSSRKTVQASPVAGTTSLTEETREVNSSCSSALSLSSPLPA